MYGFIGDSLGWAISMPYDQDAMFMLLPAMTGALLLPADGEYRVIEVERHEFFAGRLGRRVSQTLVAEKDGQRYQIVLGRAHTAIRGSVREYASGDIVRPDWGSQVRPK